MDLYMDNQHYYLFIPQTFSFYSHNTAVEISRVKSLVGEKVTIYDNFVTLASDSHTSLKVLESFKITGNGL